MNHKRKNIVSIDIDAGAIKLVYGNINKDEIVVKKADRTLLPEHVVQDGRVLNPDILENVIKNMLKSMKIKGNQCYCTFESSQMISREVLIPGSPNANFQELAMYEMAQFLPVEIKNYIVQAKKIRDVVVDGKSFTEALATAVPKQLVESMHQIIDSAGLKPLVLDTHSNAIAKLLEVQNRINEVDILDKTVAYIEFGSESIFVSIFQKGKFKLSRLMPRGSTELDSNIARFLEIPLEVATYRKMTIHSLLEVPLEEEGEEARLRNIIKSSMEEWFDEINKTFRYYASRNKGYENIEAIFVYGSIAKIKDMPKFMESYLKIPTDSMTKIKKIDWSGIKEQELSEYFYALGTMYRR